MMPTRRCTNINIPCQRMDLVKNLLQNLVHMSPCQEIPTILGFVVQCMQDEPTTQACNFNYKKRSLLKQVIYSYFLLSFDFSTKKIIITPCRQGHEPQTQISNLKSLNRTSAIKFPSLALFSAQLHTSTLSLLTIISHQYNSCHA